LEKIRGVQSVKGKNVSRRLQDGEKPRRGKSGGGKARKEGTVSEGKRETSNAASGVI